MSFLPNIGEDGSLKEDQAVPKLYTPPLFGARRIVFDADTLGRDKKKYTDAPVMADIHECVPNEHGECALCSREMLV